MVPMLVEAVRRRLDGEMGDPFPRQFIQRAMQADRIGRGQRTIDFAPGRHHADGADACGLMAERRPNLAGKGHDRSLAAGAGDRRDHFRLLWINPCGSQRQHVTGVGDLDEGRVGKWPRRLAFGGDGHRPGRDRLGSEGQPVRLGSRQRDEKIARLHRAAVRRHAADLGPGQARIERGHPCEKIGKRHKPLRRPGLRLSSPAEADNRGSAGHESPLTLMDTGCPAFAGHDKSHHCRSLARIS
jgi:hypothetical protein